MAKQIYESYVGWDSGYGPNNGDYSKSRDQNRQTRWVKQPSSKLFDVNHKIIMSDRTSYLIGLTGGFPHEVYS